LTPLALNISVLLASAAIVTLLIISKNSIRLPEDASNSAAPKSPENVASPPLKISAETVNGSLRSISAGDGVEARGAASLKAASGVSSNKGSIPMIIC